VEVLCIVEKVLPSVGQEEDRDTHCRNVELFLPEKKKLKAFNPVSYEVYFSVAGLDYFYWREEELIAGERKTAIPPFSKGVFCNIYIVLNTNFLKVSLLLTRSVPK